MSSHSRRKNRRKKRAYKSDEREEDQLTPTTQNFQNKLTLTSLKTENNNDTNMTITTNNNTNSSNIQKEESEEVQQHSHDFCCHHGYCHGFDSHSSCENCDEDDDDDPEKAQKAEREYFANVIQAFLYYNDYTQQLITKMENDWNRIPEHHQRYNHNTLDQSSHNFVNPRLSKLKLSFGLSTPINSVLLR
jgi:hypothetical protein